MIGAWCFLDHAGPVTFPAGNGLDVGPHPHIGLQTFTWMIEGTMMHTDSLGSKQLIRPKQVNLMTAGHGISHTEVAPDTETQMHAAQLWIALPDHKRNMDPKFEHYPDLPVVEKDGLEFTVLVGEYLETTSPVVVHTPLVGVDLIATQDTKTRIPLNPEFEYGFMALDGVAHVNGHELTADNMVVLDTGLNEIEIEVKKGNRVLLIGGEPFETPILLWWNFVARTMDDLKKHVSNGLIMTCVLVKFRLCGCPLRSTSSSRSNESIKMTAVIASSKAKPLAEQWKGEITSGRHQYFCDEPEKLEGHDQGPAPYDLLTGSLAACTLITLRMYAKHKGYDFGEYSVEIDFHTNREHEEHIERRIVFKELPNEELQQKS